MQKAVFLDRDGTINSDEFGYVNKPADFHLYPFAAEAIKILNEMNFLLFVVTNQSGLARGYYSRQDLENIHAKMNAELKEKNAFLTRIYYSPYHQEGHVAPFNIEHEDRKPGLGMFKKARQEYGFRINRSYMIGDKFSDVVFGRKAGLKTILLLSGCGEQEFLQNRHNRQLKPHFVAENLLQAALLIKTLESDRK